MEVLLRSRVSNRFRASIKTVVKDDAPSTESDGLTEHEARLESEKRKAKSEEQ